MASIAVSDYEVKLLLKSSAVLRPDNKLKDTVLSTFSIPTSTKKINFQFLDTDTKDVYQNGWILRMRKIEGSNELELTYKKRYPINTRESVDNSEIDIALKAAEMNGFDSATTYKAQVELGYRKHTLSISQDKILPNFGLSEMELPLEDKSREIATNNAPVEFQDWLVPNWGNEKLSQSRVHGPVFARRSKGKWGDSRLNIEVWPVKNMAGTGMEHIVEASFKTRSLAEALEERNKLGEFLQSKGWLLAEDFSRTWLILERY
jgi:hypothetical protein